MNQVLGEVDEVLLLLLHRSLNIMEYIVVVVINGQYKLWSTIDFI